MSEKDLARVDRHENELLKLALAKDIGIDVMESLLAMAQKVREEEARSAWHLAMAEFQMSVPEIVKNKTATIKTKAGYSFEYSYASLDAVIAAVRPALAGVGLSITFDVKPHANGMEVTCIVGHAGGHRERCPVIIPISTDNFNAAQSVASAMTYGRRLSCLCALGLAPEDFDDDGVGTGSEEVKAPKSSAKVAASRAAKVAAKAAPVSRDEELDGLPIWRGLIVNMVPVEGVGTNKKPYKIFVFHTEDGKKFGTFSESLSTSIMKHDFNEEIEIVYGVNPSGNMTIEECRMGPFA